MNSADSQNLCFHCDLAVPAGEHYQLDLLGHSRQFCCPGCLAIAETIRASQMEDFYRFRQNKSPRAEDLLPAELFNIESLDNPELLDEIAQSFDETTRTIELGIDGITCAACGWLIKSQLRQRPEVKTIQVNITHRRAVLQLSLDAPLSPIIRQLRQLGYQAYPFSEDAEEALAQQQHKAFIRRLLVAGLAMMQVMMFATGLYIGEFQDISPQHAYFLHWVSGLLATPVVFYSAQPFFKSALTALKTGHFGMNLPVAIAISAAYSASVYSLFTHDLSGHDLSPDFSNHNQVYYFDSVVMFIFFLLIGRFLEQHMRLKAILKQQNFKRLLPLSVCKRHADGSLENILVKHIQAGDELIINAGGVVPVDGILLDESAELNQAVLTGEFLPVSKQRHDAIISGSTNTGGGFTLKATTDLSHSRVQSLIQLQQGCDNLSSDPVTLADKIANGYVLTLLLLAVASGLVWWQIDPERVFPIILSLLVVSCPCALSLATPTAVAAAIAQLTELGLMVKGKHTLSRLAEVKQLVFDKTGTLTLGRMSIVKTEIEPGFSKNQCLQIAQTLEAQSNHPIAEAFKHFSLAPLKMTDGKEVIAGGVQGEIQGQVYRLGKHSFACPDQTHAFACPDPISQDKNQPSPASSSSLPLYLGTNGRAMARFELSDQLNDTAYPAICQLNKRYPITLLSGDTAASCQSLADKLAIQQVIANATPESKLETVRSLQQTGSPVLMVGDGINDVGALAEASVSITLGIASQVSRSDASAVLVSHDLTVIASALQIARKMRRIIQQNLAWAVSYNLLAIPFALAGWVPPWLAAIGMTSSSILVVVNALRLRQNTGSTWNQNSLGKP